MKLPLQHELISIRDCFPALMLMKILVQKHWMMPNLGLRILANPWQELSLFCWGLGWVEGERESQDPNPIYNNYAPPAMSIATSTPLKTTRNFSRDELFLSFLLVVPLAWTTSLGVFPIKLKSGTFRFDLVISSSTGGACMYRFFPRNVILDFDNCSFGCSSSKSMNCDSLKKLSQPKWANGQSYVK